MAHAKLAQVRQRYLGRCGYCGVSEVDAGGELTVDHHHPVAAGGDDRDDNLVYACFRCNVYKGDFCPDATDLARGWRVLHPLRDDVAAHLRLRPDTGHLEPLTETGRFHITVLRLNRPELVAHRLRDQALAQRAARQQLMEAENEQLHALVTELRSYCFVLSELLGLPPP